LGNAGVPVEVYEAGDYPRHRVCGEFIAGLGDATIEKLGIGTAVAGAGSHRCVTWFLRGRVVGRQTLPAPARAVSRFALDARLAGLFVAGGGKLIPHTRVPPPAGRTGWVDTGGRKPSGASPWIGLKLHASKMDTEEGLELHLGDGAYVGLAAVEEGWINLCGLFRRRPGLRFEREQALPTYLRACGLARLAERLAAAQIRPGSPCAVAGLAFARGLAAGDGVELGDAGAMIPPFTGNGMAMAFVGASIALDPLVAWARGGPSWSETTGTIHRALRREFNRRLVCAASLHPFLLRTAGQSCLGAAARAGLLPVSTLYRLLH